MDHFWDDWRVNDGAREGSRMVKKSKKSISTSAHDVDIPAHWLGKIHQGDCVAQMKKLPDQCVHLAFADPPFNIGYEYDEYDDRLDSEKYLEWSQTWMLEVHRILASNGAFWLAIGDEYAAELKIEAQKIGFHCRSWVIWYYTFGVHCKNKFTRSHAHLFHFVKDKDDFTFNPDAVKVPSARQLVYNDARAASGGRMPDDTFILRPQDCVDGFTPDEDTWYFPRVAGTFKERAGFHGCQMPEQLLGRVIKSSSNPNDVVLDPFSGSATTLAAAKKLGRRFLGFELSQDYVMRGSRRLEGISCEDRLEGADEPKVSAPATISADFKKLVRVTNPEMKGIAPKNQTLDIPDSVALIEAFAATYDGYSLDRVIADKELNEVLQTECERRSIEGTAGTRNRALFGLRKKGLLTQAGIRTSVRTEFPWDHLSSFMFASEIAWRRTLDEFDLSLDDILCDPLTASHFDNIAQSFAPGFSSLEYRWAAFSRRKRNKKAFDTARNKVTELKISKFRKGTRLEDLDFEAVPSSEGVYGVAIPSGKTPSFLFTGETVNLRMQLEGQFRKKAILSAWLNGGKDLQIYFSKVSTVQDHPLARTVLLQQFHEPKWNVLERMSI